MGRDRDDGRVMGRSGDDGRVICSGGVVWDVL